MAKGILLLDYLPTRCADCELRNSISIDNTVCHVNMKSINDSEYFGKKPSWCSLRDRDKFIEDIRCRCYEMGLDESQTEIIVSELN